MAAQAIIQHQLGLVVRLIDSTTGKEITERRVNFCPYPPKSAPVARGGGTYLFLGMDREDFSMEVRVYGYEPRTVKILFGRLEEHLPIQEIYLLPAETLAQGNRLLTLRGRLPGIQAIEAVSLTETNCCIRSFDAKRRIMTVLNPHNIRLIHTYYGLISQDRVSYEPICIEEGISSQEIRLKEPLSQEFTINQPLVRVIYGQTEEDGSYMLKVQGSQIARYLVRFELDGKSCFKQVDFHQTDGGGIWE